MASKPIHEIRLGRVKAAIWENEVGNSTRYNTTFVNSYRIKEEDREAGDNGWRETSSFGRDDLPLLAKLADQAHTWCYQTRSTQTQNAA
jgi:hypothetical protein